MVFLKVQEHFFKDIQTVEQYEKSNKIKISKFAIQTIPFAITFYVSHIPILFLPACFIVHLVMSEGLILLFWRIKIGYQRKILDAQYIKRGLKQ